MATVEKTALLGMPTAPDKPISKQDKRLRLSPCLFLVMFVGAIAWFMFEPGSWPSTLGRWLGLLALTVEGLSIAQQVWVRISTLYVVITADPAQEEDYECPLGPPR